jgi:drug/metabolite transporter (DMT)-like permease
MPIWTLPPPARVAWLLASGVATYAVADPLFLSAAQRLGTPRALAIASTFPLWSAVAALLTGEHLSWLKGLGIGTAIAGICALHLATPKAGERKRVSTRSGAMAVGCAILASFFWAFNVIALREGARGLGIFHANALRCLVTLPLLAVMTARVGVRVAGRQQRRMLISAIIADSVAGCALFGFALMHGPLAVGSALGSLAPLMSVPMAAWCGDEPFDPVRFGAICLAFLGAALLGFG